MEIRSTIGSSDVAEAEAVLKMICRVIKEEFPDNAAEIVLHVVRITL
jgi:hypothetical protein